MKSEIVTTPERSRLMARVRHSGTSAEIAVRNILERLGIEFERNLKDLPGSPDLANRNNKWAIFVHGCFWHAHENCGRWKIPIRNRAFWEDKFRKNRARDEKKIYGLEEKGYSVKVIWECELEDEEKLVKNIQDFFALYEIYKYSRSKKSVLRTVSSKNGMKHSTRIFLKNVDVQDLDAQSAYDLFFLRKRSRPRLRKYWDVVRCVDLYSGCGGLSFGAMEACRAIGKKFVSVAAVDNDTSALKIYKKNIRCVNAFANNINELLDGNLGSDLTENEKQFLEKILPVKILLAGPPCQGYSDLNNHTRRDDPRNALYQRVIRFVEIAKPEHVLVENVPTVVHGKDGEIDEAIKVMKNLDYNVSDDVVDLAEIGVPQKRNRHVLIGSTSKDFSIKNVIGKYRVEQERTVTWAISDLEEVIPKDIFDTPSRHSEDNMKRITFLHENDLYNLPDHYRPSCHQDGNHSYKSMYGRMRPNEPSQTITSGFGSPGQGRYIHPTKLRTITPHEAARLQFFPDFYKYSSVQKRTKLAEMIGNAVPMKLSYIFCLEFLG